MNFNIIDIFNQVFDDLFSYIGIDHKFMCEVPSKNLNSTEPINTLVSILGDMEGNIMFGYTEKTAKEISAKLQGIKDLPELNIYTKASLTDFFGEFCRRTINTIRLESSFNVNKDSKDYVLLSSDPTYISGGEMYGSISRVPSKKLFFKVGGEKFAIAYNLEELK